jgi:hypothetical protein
VNDVKIDWRPLITSAGILDNVVVAAFWTLNGKPVRRIPLPNGGLVQPFGGPPQRAPFADDACFELSYGKAGIARAVWTVNEKPIASIPIPTVPGSTLRANDVCWYGYGQTGIG